MLSFDDININLKKKTDEFEDYSLLNKNPQFLGLDRYIKYIKIDKDNFKITIPDEVYKFIINSPAYIKDLGMKIIQDSKFNNIDRLIDFYKNEAPKKNYDYEVKNIKFINEELLQNYLRNNFLLDFINIFSHAFYITDNKYEQTSSIINFLNTIINHIYNNDNNDNNLILQLLKTLYRNSSIVDIFVYKEEKSRHPFTEIENYREFLKNFNSITYLDNLQDIIKKTFKSKLFIDLTKGKINNVDKLNNAILLMFFLIICIIELYMRNMYEMIKIIKSLEENMINSNSSNYIPELYTIRKEIENEDISILSYEAYNYGNIDKTEDARLDEKYKSSNEEAYKLYLRTIKSFTVGIKNWIDSKFFLKYMGHMKDLYKYADDEKAYVIENEVNDDPVVILKDKGPKILDNISVNSIKLFNDVINLAKEVSNSKDVEDKLNDVIKFCKVYKIDKDMSPDQVKTQIIKETLLRVAKILLQETPVYGYTEESMVEKRDIPKAAHVVASIFLKNPLAQPEKIKISEIFSGPESFEIFAKSDFTNYFSRIYKGTTQKIISNINYKVSIQATKNLHNSYTSYMKMSAQNKEDKPSRNDVKMVKSINKAISTVVEIAWKQKLRSLQMIDSMLNMSREIVKLAKKCVIILVNIENVRSDRGYDLVGKPLSKNEDISKKFYTPRTNITIDKTK